MLGQTLVLFAVCEWAPKVFRLEMLKLNVICAKEVEVSMFLVESRSKVNCAAPVL